jgi:hypothetical protein
LAIGHRRNTSNLHLPRRHFHEEKQVSAESSIRGICGGVGLAALTLATMGILSPHALFWSLPIAILSGSAAAAGIAWINAVRNLASYPTA